MKPEKKKITSFLLTLCMLLTLLPLSAAPVWADVQASGTWGTCPWEIDANGKLTIKGGTGEDTFSPDEDCVLAQIVTFLYRALSDTAGA